MNTEHHCSTLVRRISSHGLKANVVLERAKAAIKEHGLTPSVQQQLAARVLLIDRIEQLYNEFVQQNTFYYIANGSLPELEHLEPSGDVVYFIWTCLRKKSLSRGEVYTVLQHIPMLLKSYTTETLSRVILFTDIHVEHVSVSASTSQDALVFHLRAQAPQDGRRAY
jgi:hypothetical protein